jgi:hypothetical protein
MKPLYDVALYIDEDGARSALTSFRGKKLAKLLGKSEFHDAVRTGNFAKAILIHFAAPQRVSGIKEDFAANLSEAGVVKEDVAALLACLKKDFVAGAELTLAMPNPRTVTILEADQACGEVQSESLSRGLLGLWLGKKKLSAQPDGLLARVEPLLARDK